MRLTVFLGILLLAGASAKILPSLPGDSSIATDPSGEAAQGPPIWMSTKGATTIDGSVFPVETGINGNGHTPGPSANAPSTTTPVTNAASSTSVSAPASTESVPSASEPSAPSSSAVSAPISSSSASPPASTSSSSASLAAPASFLVILAILANAV